MGIIVYMENLKSLDIRTVLPETLENIEDVVIDTNLSVEDRMRAFVKQINRHEAQCLFIECKTLFQIENVEVKMVKCCHILFSLSY